MQSNTQQMRIEFDLDNIFISTPPLIPNTWIEKIYKQKDNGGLFYRIPSYPDQLIRQLAHFPLFRPPMKQNLAFLQNLAQENPNLYLISSRYKFLEKRTKEIIKKYSLDKQFRQMYFNFTNQQPHLFKNDVIKKLRLDRYVDDDLSLLHYVAKENQKTNFYWLHSGKTDKMLPKNIMKIEKLEEIVK